jgi:hypothetical protein
MKRDDETWIEYAQRIRCDHAWYLSWATTGCEGCRKRSLSPSLERLERLYDKEG